MLEKGIILYHFNGERDLDIIMDTVMELGEPDKVFALVRRLKEERNSFFKRGEYDLAITV